MTKSREVLSERRLTCPKCGSTEVGGWEDPSIYDGVYKWQCMKCRHRWPRKGFEKHFNADTMEKIVPLIRALLAGKEEGV